MASPLLVLALLLSQSVAPDTPSQPQNVPLENVHVAVMAVQHKMPENIILYIIQTRPSKFDTSAAALDALKGLGVSDTIIRAMVVAAQSPLPQSSSPVGALLPPSQPTAFGAPLSYGQLSSAGPLSASLIRGEESESLTASQAQITQVKANMGDDFKSIATSMAAQQLVLELGARAMASTALKFGSGAAGAFAGPLVAASMLFHKAPTYTFVLALPGAQARTKVHGSDLKVEVRYDQVPGLNPDFHEPVLLKLPPTKSNLRLVRAQKFKLKNGGFQAGKEKVLQAAVSATVTKLARGHAILEATGLAPGEYGLILRNVGPSETLLYPQAGLQQVPYDMSTMVWDFSLSPAEEPKPSDQAVDAEAGPPPGDIEP